MSVGDPPDIRAVMGSAIMNAILDTSRTEIDGVSTAIFNPEYARQALLIALAMLLEADPSWRTRKDMREAAERAARDLRLQIQTFRDHFEETGVRAWDAQAVKVQ